MHDKSATSVAPGGERKLWLHVWSGRVPPKVNVFVWKLTRDVLPTRRVKFMRQLELSDRCPLCEPEAESSFYGMQLHNGYVLPDEEQFPYIGPDCLVLLLDRCSPTQKSYQVCVLNSQWRN